MIDSPDLTCSDENAYRAALLGEVRGYRRQGDVFRFVPDDTAWHRYALAPEDLARVRYINDDYWAALSGGSRLATDAAPRIRQGIAVFGVSSECYLHLARDVERGAQFPALILVGAHEGADLTVLEGHVRLTAYCLALAHVPNPLTAIVGFGQGIERV